MTLTQGKSIPPMGDILTAQTPPPGEVVELPTPSRAIIFDRIQATLVEALGVDEEEVVGESMLTGDLGAESIDFLDIVFRLEKKFGFKIPRGDLFPENVLSDPRFISEGKLTEQGLGELRTRMPWANFDRLKEYPSVQDLFTVDMIVNYVESRLGETASYYGKRHHELDQTAREEQAGVTAPPPPTARDAPEVEGTAETGGSAVLSTEGAMESSDTRKADSEGKPAWDRDLTEAEIDAWFAEAETNDTEPFYSEAEHAEIWARVLAGIEQVQARERQQRNDQR